VRITRSRGNLGSPFSGELRAAAAAAHVLGAKLIRREWERRVSGGGIYLVRGEEDLIELRAARYESEEILQALIARYPGLLAGDARAGSARRWLLVGREAGLPDRERLTRLRPAAGVRGRRARASRTENPPGGSGG
jgi:hypothetical protein